MDGVNRKEEIRSLVLAAGFVRAGFLSPFVSGLGDSVSDLGNSFSEPKNSFSDPENSVPDLENSVPDQGNFVSAPEQGAPQSIPPAPSLLTAALVYGNCFSDELSSGGSSDLPRAYIAPFARRNYYREAVKRLQGLAKELRARFGGKKADFRILCNSPAPEKPLAAASGLGAPGRNGLILTEEAGSLFIIAAMTLPWELPGDTAAPPGFPLCSHCDPLHPPCVDACPTGAARGDGALTLSRCIQWYASGHGGASEPEEVRRQWGRRLYGCTECQDACVWNRRPIEGVESAEGPLPAFLDPGALLAMDDESLKKKFRGTALGLSWLGPAAIKRNARLALH